MNSEKMRVMDLQAYCVARYMTDDAGWRWSSLRSLIFAWWYVMVGRTGKVVCLPGGERVQLRHPNPLGGVLYLPVLAQAGIVLCALVSVLSVVAIAVMLLALPFTLVYVAAMAMLRPLVRWQLQRKRQRAADKALKGL